MRHKRKFEGKRITKPVDASVISLVKLTRVSSYCTPNNGATPEMFVYGQRFCDGKTLAAEGEWLSLISSCTEVDCGLFSTAKDVRAVPTNFTWRQKGTAHVSSLRNAHTLDSRRAIRSAGQG